MRFDQPTFEDILECDTPGKEEFVRRQDISHLLKVFEAVGGAQKSLSTSGIGFDDSNLGCIIKLTRK